MISAELSDKVQQYYAWARDWYTNQTRTKQIAVTATAGIFVLAVVGGLATFVLSYKDAVLSFLYSFSKTWKEMPGGYVLLFFLVVLVAFPPLIGYSALSTMVGMVFGFPWGWPFLAAGTIVGSSLSFLTFRYFLEDRARQLAHSSSKFEALAKAMDRHDSFTLLWMIRLCPLPYSLSNGALASIHTVKFSKFALATAIITPKLLVHVFVGDRLVRLGSEKDTASRVVDGVSIVIAGLASTGTAWMIYKRTRVVTEEYERLDDENGVGERNFTVSD